MERLSEDDWGDVDRDIDYRYAFDKFKDKSDSQLQDYFFSSPFDATECLRYMHAKPFMRYFLFFNHLLDNLDPAYEDADAFLARFFSIVEDKLRKQPEAIYPIMEKLMPNLEYYSENQEKFDASPEDYGDFKEAYVRIKELFLRASRQEL